MKIPDNKSKDDPRSLYPSDLSAIVDKKLKKLLGDYKDIPEDLEGPIRYCVLSGGKRFRPVLSLATSISFGKQPQYVLPLACAIEFIHSYSLIHDDLPAIDNDDLRRGKPSCHKKFGEDIAILTGDALFAEAFNIILRHQEGSPVNILKAISEIAEASGASGMVAGQIIDIKTSNSKISREKLEYMHINKTARLITAAVTGPAILCGAGEDILEKYREYGMNVGLAFQITDDIIDITSESSEMGKTQGKDRKQAKNTYPLLWGIEKSKKIAAEKIEMAINTINETGNEIQLLGNIAQFILVRRA
jgi:geranylgeranyl diphosphate synthase type II